MRQTAGPPGTRFGGRFLPVPVAEAQVFRAAAAKVACVVLALGLAFCLAGAAPALGQSKEEAEEEEFLDPLLRDDDPYETKSDPTTTEGKDGDPFAEDPQGPGSDSGGTIAPEDRDKIRIQGDIEGDGSSQVSEAEAERARAYVVATVERKLKRLDGKVPGDELALHLTYAPSPEARGNPALRAYERELWVKKVGALRQDTAAPSGALGGGTGVDIDSLPDHLPPQDGGAAGGQTAEGRGNESAPAAAAAEAGAAAGGTPPASAVSDRRAPESSETAGQGQDAGTGEASPASPSPAFARFVEQSGVLESGGAATGARPAQGEEAGQGARPSQEGGSAETSSARAAVGETPVGEERANQTASSRTGSGGVAPEPSEPEETASAAAPGTQVTAQPDQAETGTGAASQTAGEQTGESPGSAIAAAAGRLMESAARSPAGTESASAAPSAQAAPVGGPREGKTEAAMAGPGLSDPPPLPLRRPESLVPASPPTGPGESEQLAALNAEEQGGTPGAPAAGQAQSQAPGPDAPSAAVGASDTADTTAADAGATDAAEGAPPTVPETRPAATEDAAESTFASRFSFDEELSALGSAAGAGAQPSSSAGGGTAAGGAPGKAAGAEQMASTNAAQDPGGLQGTQAAADDAPTSAKRPEDNATAAGASAPLVEPSPTEPERQRSEETAAIQKLQRNLDNPEAAAADPLTSEEAAAVKRAAERLEATPEQAERLEETIRAKEDLVAEQEALLKEIEADEGMRAALARLVSLREQGVGAAKTSSGSLEIIDPRGPAADTAGSVEVREITRQNRLRVLRSTERTHAQLQHDRADLFLWRCRLAGLACGSLEELSQELARP